MAVSLPNGTSLRAQDLSALVVRANLMCKDRKALWEGLVVADQA
jgi:hypothetical protein